APIPSQTQILPSGHIPKDPGLTTTPIRHTRANAKNAPTLPKTTRKTCLTLQDHTPYGFSSQEDRVRYNVNKNSAYRAIFASVADLCCSFLTESQAPAGGIETASASQTLIARASTRS